MIITVSGHLTDESVQHLTGQSLSVFIDVFLPKWEGFEGMFVTETQALEVPLSAVTKGSCCSIFQDLPDCHNFAPLQIEKYSFSRTFSYHNAAIFR